MRCPKSPSSLGASARYGTDCKQGQESAGTQEPAQTIPLDEGPLEPLRAVRFSRKAKLLLDPKWHGISNQHMTGTSHPAIPWIQHTTFETRFKNLILCFFIVSKVFRQCFSSVSPVFLQCFASVYPVFRKCFASVSQVFRQCFASVSLVFRLCFANVSPMFLQCFCSVSHVFPNGSNVSRMFL